MGMKYFAGAIAVFLFLVFNVAIAWKIKEPALAVMILIGFVLMMMDLYQSLKIKDDGH